MKMAQLHQAFEDYTQLQLAHPDCMTGVLHAGSD